jgi:hypothetical protein
VFGIGDIIKHKREDRYYLVIDIKIYFGISLERIEYTVIGDGDGVEHILIHPLMTINYEKIE